MIRIKGSQHPAAIEREIASVVAPNTNQLQLPVHPKDWWFGGEAGLVQLSITWSRNRTDSTLVSYVQRGDDPAPQLEAMSKRLFGFVALLMANEILDVQDAIAIKTGAAKQPLRTLRPPAYKACKDVVEMMFQPISQFAIGSKVFLASVDHSTLWSIPWLYSTNKTVLDRIAFHTLAKELINKVAPVDGARSIHGDTTLELAAILHELFKNTHDWGRHDNNGIPWRRSVRGLSVEFHSWSPEDCEVIVKHNPALRGYFESFEKRNTIDRHRLLEINVFDSGLGLARQWLGTSWRSTIALQDEYDTVTKCLTKHSSSSKNRDRGLGLAEVMSTVNSVRGLIRLRTGRLSIYRDFMNSPLMSEDDVLLSDFPTSGTTLSLLPSVYGTHYQILIPVALSSGR